MNILVIAKTETAPGYQPLGEASSADEMQELIPGWMKGLRNNGIAPTALEAWTRNGRGHWTLNEAFTQEATKAMRAAR